MVIATYVFLIFFPNLRLEEIPTMVILVGVLYPPINLTCTRYNQRVGKFKCIMCGESPAIIIKILHVQNSLIQIQIEKIALRIFDSSGFLDATSFGSQAAAITGVDCIDCMDMHYKVCIFMITSTLSKAIQLGCLQKTISLLPDFCQLVLLCLVVNNSVFVVKCPSTNCPSTYFEA
ncbi:hypothetical protein ACJIZ3_000005 [Penstemon smallii]|uniref:Uncharacterized protein n=1 Tax=Penstemon smallii TaxID=265156 RepID=A0ABD3RCD7_9LAMI